MILSAAEFLAELLEREKRKLKEFELDHAPTIGRMYEGLATNILGRAIPAELGLRLVDGFVIDGLGGRSGQIDCMLVCGEGSQIPHMSSYQWHVRDVIAVLEIKKTLLGSDLADAFAHLRQVKDLVHSYLQSQRCSDEVIDVRTGLKAFAQITHTVAPSYEEVSRLSVEEQVLFHTIVSEHYGPIKVVLGYDGFKTELGFRQSLVRILTSNLGRRGYGPGSCPELIVSGRYSLAKANGSPYVAPMEDEYWDFYFSSPTNPLLLLLEFIWTQLDGRFGIAGLWGEDLETEVAHPFLAARPGKRGSQVGWELLYRDVPAKALAEATEADPWKPELLSLEEAVVVQRLCVGDAVLLDDPELRTFLETRGVAIEDLKKRLIGTNLVALRGDELQLTTEACVCAVIPTGEFVAAENSTGRLDRWIEKHFPSSSA